MGDSIISGDSRKRLPVMNWREGATFEKDMVVVFNSRLYLVLDEHTASNDIESDINLNKLELLTPNEFESGDRLLGPFLTRAGYRSNNNPQTGEQYSDYANDEIVVGYKPEVSSTYQDGGWYGVYTHLGFTLKLKKIRLDD